MGLQLPIKESSDVIIRAINMAGDNLNTHFYHLYSTPGHQGFYVEIDNLDLTAQLEKISPDYNSEDHVFTLNIPYEYFNDDKLPIDDKIGVNITDHLEVKAEIRCIVFITKTYNDWIKTHGLFTTKDLKEIINQALDKLRAIKHLDFGVASGKGETAEKYLEIWFTESHIPQTGGSFTNRFFPVEFHLKDYYEDVGNNVADGLIGESKLRGKKRDEICLLRVAYLLYSEFVGWLHNKWPNIYKDYKNKKF